MACRASDWRRYLGEQLGEHKNIDFKAASAWSGESRVRLAADILAMSNTAGGGVLVIGVSEDAAKRLQLDGCDDTQLRSFDRTPIVDYLATRAAPEVDVQIEKPTHDGKTCIVIRVAEFSQTPLIVTTDLQFNDGQGRSQCVARKGDILIRTNAAQTARVASEQAMRELIRLSVLKTREEIVVGIRALLDAEARPRAKEDIDVHQTALADWSTTFHAWRNQKPDQAFFVAQLLPATDLSAGVDSLSTLRARVESADVRLQGTDFPGQRHATARNVGQAVEWSIGDDHLWRSYRTGAFFYAARLRTGFRDDDGRRTLYLWEACQPTASIFPLAASLYGSFGADIDFSVEVAFAPVEGVLLIDTNQGFLPHRYMGGGSCISHVDRCNVKVQTSSGKTAAGWTPEAINAVADIFETFNVPDAKRRAEKFVRSLGGAHQRRPAKDDSEPVDS